MSEIKDPSDATILSANENSISKSTSTKKKRKKRAPKKHILTQFTIRDPPWTYIRLQRLTYSSTAPPLDAITAQLHLTAALSQFLGLHGAAIPFDVLKVEEQDLWIRVHAEDRPALVAAVGGWISSNGEGWTVKAWSSWDANPMNERGQDLFIN